MEYDSDSAWDTSKPECQFDMGSVSQEYLNNIPYNGNTDVSINYLRSEVEDDDTRLLEVRDNGRGFLSKEVVDKAMTIATTTGEGNSNFGIGIKSSMLIQNESGVYILVCGKKLQLVLIYKFFKENGVPEILEVSEAVNAILLKQYAGETVVLTLFGSIFTDKRGRPASLEERDVMDIIVNKTDMMHVDIQKGSEAELSFTERMSIDYSDILNKGNTVAINGQTLQPRDIFNSKNAEGIMTGPDKYTRYFMTVQIQFHEKGECLVTFIDCEGQVVESGRINNRKKAFDYTKNSKAASDLAMECELTI